MKTFQGRVVTPGCAQAEALVTHGGLNTLASFQKSLQFGDKTAKCGDQNNPDLYGKPMAGKALCLPQTIGSTTGGLVLYCACALDRQPAPFSPTSGSSPARCRSSIPSARTSWPMSRTACPSPSGRMAWSRWNKPRGKTKTVQPGHGLHLVFYCPPSCGFAGSGSGK